MKTLPILLMIAAIAACTTKFKDVDAGDGDGDVEPDGETGDVDAADDGGDVPSDPAAEEPTACTGNDECVDRHGEGYMCCDGLCVDTASDESNCGGCGAVCSAGLRCCGGACVNIDTDMAHCGECGHACGGDDICCGGLCCPAAACCDGLCCGEGLTCCDSECVDTRSSLEHCGACGHACEPGLACAAEHCEPCVFEFPAMSELCYIDGEHAALSRYSYLGRLAPAADARLDHPPDFLNDDYYVPSFGFHTVDLIDAGDRFGHERDYLVRIALWNREGSIVHSEDDFVATQSVMAFDAFPMVIDGNAQLAYTGLQHDGMQGDYFVIKRADLAVPEFFLDYVRSSSNDAPPSATGWELPWPNEFGSSMAAADNPEGHDPWSILAGGAVLMTPGRRATIHGLGRVDGVWTLGGGTGDESMVTHLAYGTGPTEGIPRLYALVAHRYTAAGSFNVELRCFDLSDTSLSTTCDNAAWTAGVMVADSAADEFGSGLVVAPNGNVIFAFSTPPGVVSVGAVLPNGSRITDFGGSGLADLRTNGGLHARILKILIDRNGYIFFAGYQASDSPTSNYQKTPTLWKLAPSGYPSMPFCGGRCDHGEGLYSDAMWLCDGTILLRRYEDPWSQAVDEYEGDRICLSRVDPVTGDVIP
jgi:hypothetical protein